MSRPLATRLLKAVALPSLLALAALQIHAAPVPVSVSNFSFTPGSGYGVDDDERSGTLLDVLFGSTIFTAQSFVLSAAADSFTFDVGTVQLREENDHGGILGDETDNLGVAAHFTFTSPFGSIVEVAATGLATPGSVSDSAADLTIQWNPLQMAFGSGGLLGITLSTLTFTEMQTLTQTATVTLLNPGVDPAPAQVPAPGTLLLSALALAALGFVRRARRG